MDETLAEFSDILAKGGADLPGTAAAVRKLQARGALKWLVPATRIGEDVPTLLVEDGGPVERTPENAVCVALAFNAFCDAMRAGVFDAVEDTTVGLG